MTADRERIARPLLQSGSAERGRTPAAAAAGVPDRAAPVFDGAREPNQHHLKMRNREIVRDLRARRRTACDSAGRSASSAGPGEFRTVAARRAGVLGHPRRRSRAGAGRALAASMLASHRAPEVVAGGDPAKTPSETTARPCGGITCRRRSKSSSSWRCRGTARRATATPTTRSKPSSKNSEERRKKPGASGKATAVAWAASTKRRSGSRVCRCSTASVGWARTRGRDGRERTAGRDESL